MATLTHLTSSEANACLAPFDLGKLEGFAPIPAGSVNSNFRLSANGKPYFFRVFEEQDIEGARFEAELLAFMHRGGVPVPVPLPARDGQRVLQHRGKPIAVYPFVPGIQSCQKSVDRARAFAVGAALAKIHRVGLQFGRPKQGRFEVGDLRVRLARIEQSGDERFVDVAKVLQNKLAHWLSQRPDDVPLGIIHGDLFRDNVLFLEREGDRHAHIAALLDFESASTGRFVYDIAVAILAWCVGDRLECELARAMIDGYQSERPLTQSERAAMIAELATAALRFTITRITDYAMREGLGIKVVKDWRRFFSRLEQVERLHPNEILCDS